MKYSILEEGLVLGRILFIVGLVLGVRIFLKWRATGYGELFEIRSAIIVLTPDSAKHSADIFLILHKLSNAKGGL